MAARTSRDTRTCGDDGELGALEVQLVASSRGDQVSFADLYDAMAPRIFALALRILHDASQSQQVTEEVFLELWQQAGRFDPHRGTALSWVMAMAHRAAIDRARCSEAGLPPQTGARGLADACPGSSGSRSTPDARPVRAALAILSPSQRHAVEFSYYGGHTHCELAELLHVPLGTAKAELQDGLKRLRSILSPARP